MQYPIIDLLADVGGESVTGKNLMPPQNISTNIVSSDNGVYTIKGTANAYGQAISPSSFVLKAGTYTLYSNGGIPTGIGVQIRSLDGLTTYASSYDNKSTFTLNNDTEVKFRVIWYEGTWNNTIYPQIEAGSAVTDYEPYFSITFPQLSSDNIAHRLKLPMLKYYPYAVIEALQTVKNGNTLIYEQYEVLKHYLTSLGIGGI